MRPLWLTTQLDVTQYWYWDLRLFAERWHLKLLSTIIWRFKSPLYILENFHCTWFQLHPSNALKSSYLPQNSFPQFISLSPPQLMLLFLSPPHPHSPLPTPSLPTKSFLVSPPREIHVFLLVPPSIPNLSGSIDWCLFI